MCALIRTIPHQTLQVTLVLSKQRRTRCIGFNPGILCFKPCGKRGQTLETLELRPDELEALRLMDFEELYQEESAQRMGISRTTLSRTLASARRKVADALLHGKRLMLVPIAEKNTVFTTTTLKNRSQKMKKIVITAKDEQGLSGELAQHFGHSPFFVVTEVDENKQVISVAVEANPYAKKHQPGQIPQFLKTLGADVVITGGMGGRAIEFFQQLNVEVASATQPQIGAALNAYLAGQLSDVIECNHDHHDHDHQC